MELLNTKSGLEALQAAMSSGGLNLPFSFAAPGAFLAPGQQHLHHSAGSILNQANNNNNNMTSNNNNNNGYTLVSSASSHSSESSQGSGRNGLEPGNRDSMGSGGGLQSQTGSQTPQPGYQQQISCSFEEQFKQVRQQASTSPISSLAWLRSRWNSSGASFGLSLF